VLRSSFYRRRIAIPPGLTRSVTRLTEIDVTCWKISDLICASACPLVEYCQTILIRERIVPCPIGSGFSVKERNVCTPVLLASCNDDVVHHLLLPLRNVGRSTTLHPRWSFPRRLCTVRVAMLHSVPTIKRRVNERYRFCECLTVRDVLCLMYYIQYSIGILGQVRITRTDRRVLQPLLCQSLCFFLATEYIGIFRSPCQFSYDGTEALDGLRILAFLDEACLKVCIVSRETRAYRADVNADTHISPTNFQLFRGNIQVLCYSFYAFRVAETHVISMFLDRSSVDVFTVGRVSRT